jgi:hypothetical protein
VGEETHASVGAGIFKDGVAQPVEAVEARDGEQVLITFVEDYPSDEEPSEQEAEWDALLELLESCETSTGVSDLAHQHDHYLYGKPKDE